MGLNLLSITQIDQQTVVAISNVQNFPTGPKSMKPSYTLPAKQNKESTWFQK
jgi:hypothetical protein